MICKGICKDAWPLTELLKKDGFIWGKAAEEAFSNLKRAMTEVPVPALPDVLQEFVVETDASGQGLGGVLMQRQLDASRFMSEN